MIRHLITAAALLALTVTAAPGTAEVHFKVGETITFRNPYKTGCATIEIADALSREAQGLTDADARRCYKLNSDTPYRISEVQQYNGKKFYRIPLSNGELMWTYILGNRDVHESVRPGTRIMMKAPNYACSNIDTMILVDSAGPIMGANIVARHRGLVNDVCDNLPVGIELEVQQVIVSDNNWYRFVCVAKYEANAPFGSKRPCVWTRMD
jgi:hypothetical protein